MRKMATYPIKTTAVNNDVITIEKTRGNEVFGGRRVSLVREDASYAASGSMKHVR